MGDILVIEMNSIKFLSKGDVYYHSEEKEDGGCGCDSFVIVLTGHELNTGFTLCFIPGTTEIICDGICL